MLKRTIIWAAVSPQLICSSILSFSYCFFFLFSSSFSSSIHLPPSLHAPFSSFLHPSTSSTPLQSTPPPNPTTYASPPFPLLPPPHRNPHHNFNHRIHLPLIDPSYCRAPPHGLVRLLGHYSRTAGGRAMGGVCGRVFGYFFDAVCLCCAVGEVGV